VADLTLKNLTDPVEDLMTFIPPASAAYKSYLYPGFWSSGGSPSITPNAVMGDNPVAAPVTGEYNAAPPPAPAQAPSMLQSLTSINPRSGNGTSVDERAANRAKEVRDAGMVTDPLDAAKAIGLGLSLTSPTGIATLAGQTALHYMGAPDEVTDPFGALLGHPNGNPWDLKSNINLRPGYTQAYDDAIKGGLSPQGALNAAAIRTGGSARPSGAPAVPGSSAAAATANTAPAQDVTAANSVTGFNRQGTPSNPTRPQTPNVAPQFDLTAPAPAAAPATTGGGAGISGGGGIQAGQATGRPSGAAPMPGGSAAAAAANRGGGGAGASGPGGNGTGPDGHGGIGHGGARAEGGVILNDGDEYDLHAPQSERMRMRAQMTWGSHAEGGDITNDAGAMFRSATQTAPDITETADPYSDPRYNPPAESQDPRGVVDGTPIMATPGEMMIKRDAAVQYEPPVKAAMNDPRMAPRINANIEEMIAALGSGGPNDPAAMAGDPSSWASYGTSDDNSGLGVAGQTMTRVDPRVTMNSMPRGGSMLRNLSRIG
jgi:hypothetical protein